MRPETDDAIANRDYFDERQRYYMTAKSMTRQLDLEVAAVLNREVRGRTLAVGGIWDFFEWRPHLRELTVLDLSERMLNAYCPAGARAMKGDLYALDFAPATFDSIVFPMLLHHTARGGWRESVGRVVEAVERARSWLDAGGRLFIVEWCPNGAWYAAERAFLPLTRLFLKRIGQPLVIAHPRWFHERLLGRHFARVEAMRVSPPGFRWSATFPLFLNTPWLRMPFFVYPKMYLFSATVSGG
jgi:Methyltransferase domain